jgi:hypothetical protein
MVTVHQNGVLPATKHMRIYDVRLGCFTEGRKKALITLGKR